MYIYIYKSIVHSLHSLKEPGNDRGLIIIGSTLAAAPMDTHLNFDLKPTS